MQKSIIFSTVILTCLGLKFGFVVHSVLVVVTTVLVILELVTAPEGYCTGDSSLWVDGSAELFHPSAEASCIFQ